MSSGPSSSKSHPAEGRKGSKRKIEESEKGGEKLLKRTKESDEMVSKATRKEEGKREAKKKYTSKSLGVKVVRPKVAKGTESSKPPLAPKPSSPPHANLKKNTDVPQSHKPAEPDSPAAKALTTSSSTATPTKNEPEVPASHEAAGSTPSPTKAIAAPPTPPLVEESLPPSVSPAPHASPEADLVIDVAAPDFPDVEIEVDDALPVGIAVAAPPVQGSPAAEIPEVALSGVDGEIEGSLPPTDQVIEEEDFGVAGEILPVPLPTLAASLLARLGPAPVETKISPVEPEDSPSEEDLSTLPLYDQIFKPFSGEVECIEVLQVKVEKGSDAGEELMIGITEKIGDGTYGEVDGIHPATMILDAERKVIKTNVKVVEKEYNLGRVFADGTERAKYFVNLSAMGTVEKKYDNSLEGLPAEEVDEGVEVEKKFFILMDRHQSWSKGIRDLRSAFDEHGMSEEVMRKMRLWFRSLEGMVLHGQEKSVAHQDIKPGNILQDEADGHLLLCDFGSAVNYGQSWTQATESLLSPQMVRIRGEKYLNEELAAGNMSHKQKVKYLEVLEKEVYPMKGGVNVVTDFSCVAYTLWIVIDYVVCQSDNTTLNGPIPARLAIMSNNCTLSSVERIETSIREWTLKGFASFQRRVRFMRASPAMRKNPKALPFLEVLERMVAVLAKRPVDISAKEIQSCFGSIKVEGEGKPESRG